MRIACPSCQATYDVPDKVLAAGAKAVRCVRCGTEWAPVPIEPPVVAPPVVAPPVVVKAEPPAPPPEPATEIPPPPDPAPAPPERLARVEGRLAGKRVARDKPEPDPSVPPEVAAMGRGAGATIGWVLSIIILLSIGAAAISWRTQVMAAWPPSERLFAALGLF